MRGLKTGGRQRGTPNKSSGAVKAFLDRVFTRAFTEKRNELTLEDRLVEMIVTQSIDAKLFVALLTFYAGSPARQVDHNHKGKVTLEQIVAGTAAAADEDDVDEEPGA